MPRKKHRAQPFSDEDPVFQIAPMIDVLLQILVFFMAITTIQVMRTSREMTLPVAQNGQEAKSSKDTAIINIQWRGENQPPIMDIDNISVPDAGIIENYMKEAIARMPEFRAIIRADKDTQYSFIQQIMQACAAGGCSKVVFAVMNQEEIPGSKVSEAR